MSESLKYQSIERHVRDFIMQNFIVSDPDRLETHASLLEEGVIDSTGVLELVAFIEERFDIKIKDEELVPENLDSIAHIRDFIHAKLNISDKRTGTTIGVAASIS